MYIQSGELVIILRDKFRIGNKIWHSLRFRIIILVIVIGIVPAFIMEAGILKSYERRAVSVRTAEIQNQCTILSNQLSSKNYLIDTSSEIINAELMQLSNTYNGRVMIVNQEFQIIKDTYELDEGKTIVSADVIKCYQSGVGTDSFDSKNQYIEVTQPIVEITSGDIRGVMLVSVSTDVINDNMSALETNAEAIMIMIIIIVMVMGIVMAGLVMRPFRRIANEVEAVTEGYDTENLNENTYTETQLISEAVNKMLIRLRVLDDSRQEFVSNVSHELKTPLTSMKVLADSLLLQEKVPNELYKEFMGDITEEIERENKIINDLLSLVKMDRKAADLNIQSVSVNELLELILKRLRPIAALHNIEVVFESFRPVTANVDEVKLTLAISNLVENAIKYNVEEGWVHVSLNADHKYFYVKVADSGMGIPEASQEHIFERFYRVDKSHSREIGGTGLGLAITRNAIVMHRGAIKLYSREGEGTTFTIRVPLTYVA